MTCLLGIDGRAVTIGHRLAVLQARIVGARLNPKSVAFVYEEPPASRRLHYHVREADVGHVGAAYNDLQAAQSTSDKLCSPYAPVSAAVENMLYETSDAPEGK
jgi:hypothetical protein